MSQCPHLHLYILTSRLDYDFHPQSFNSTPPRIEFVSTEPTFLNNSPWLHHHQVLAEMRLPMGRHVQYPYAQVVSVIAGSMKWMVESLFVLGRQ